MLIFEIVGAILILLVFCPMLSGGNIVSR